MNLNKGERQFLDRFKTIEAKNIPAEQLNNKDKEPLKDLSLKEKINYTLESIKKELEKMPTIQRETEFHENQKQTIEEYKDILAQAIYISINEDLIKGFQLIYSQNKPFLLDAFHDIMTEHFKKLIEKQIIEKQNE